MPQMIDAESHLKPISREACFLPIDRATRIID